MSLKRRLDKLERNDPVPTIKLPPLDKPIDRSTSPSLLEYLLQFWSWEQLVEGVAAETEEQQAAIEYLHRWEELPPLTVPTPEEWLREYQSQRQSERAEPEPAAEQAELAQTDDPNILPLSLKELPPEQELDDDY